MKGHSLLLKWEVNCHSYFHCHGNTSRQGQLTEESLLALTVSEGESPWPSQQGIRQQAGRHSSGAIAESLHANPQAWGREMDGDGGRAFWNPSCTLPPTRPGFLILPRLFHQPVIENSNIPISLWGPFSFNHYTNEGDQPKKETVFRSLGRFIFIFEGKLSYQWTDGRVDNIKIKKGLNPDDEARNLELPGEASAQISIKVNKSTSC